MDGKKKLENIKMNMQRSNEDMVQQALLIIYEKYKTASFPKGIIPWAYRILDNVVKNAYQKNKRQQHLLNDSADKLAELLSSRNMTDTPCEYHEMIDEIRIAFKHLNDREREIFLLKLQGYTGTEIQQKLGIKRNIMDIRIHRGSKKLKNILLKRGIL